MVEEAFSWFIEVSLTNSSITKVSITIYIKLRREDKPQKFPLLIFRENLVSDLVRTFVDETAPPRKRERSSITSPLLDRFHAQSKLTGQPKERKNAVTEKMTKEKISCIFAEHVKENPLCVPANVSLSTTIENK